jgi:hypothetical protein
MLGGAYAASNSSGGGKATASAKAKKGPRGPKGATGPAGPVGPAGTQGPAGANGKDGSNGSNGADGQDGVSPIGTSFPGSKGACNEGQGGVELVGANTTQVCNGKKGTNGAPGTPGTDGTDGTDGTNGSPWTAGGVLPSGQTETGTWQTMISSDSPKVSGFAYPVTYTLSLPIPLSASLPNGNIQVNEPGYNGEDGIGTQHQNCPGALANPKAKAGFACVYAQAKEYTTLSFLTAEANMYVSGLRVLEFAPEFDPTTEPATPFPNNVPGAKAFGTWAVTAP